MPTQFEIAGAIRLRKLSRLYLPRSMDSRLLLKLFPLTDVDEAELTYERQRMITGLQGARGEGGPTTPVKKPGTDQFSVAPGRYGDNYEITEGEIERLREIGDWSSFEDCTKQVNRGSEHLTTRELDRYEYNIAQMMMNGVVAANDITGTEMDRQVFAIQQFTPGTLFDNLSSSTPLNYFRKLIPKLELLTSVKFREGFILCSRPTVNLILNNSNANDFFGRRGDYGRTFNNVKDLNDFMATNDLPIFKTYDEGWYSDPATPTALPGTNRFITNGKMILVGVRDNGEPIGEYRRTRASANGGKPGPWYAVEDNRQKSGLFNMILSQGHNGGAVPYYTEALAVVNAAASNSSEFL